MKKLLFIFLLLPITGVAQSISIAPYSFKAWGTTTGYVSASVEYENIGIHYFHPVQITYIYGKNYVDGKPVNLKTKEPSISTKPSFSVSYTPINISNILKVGVIVFDKPFPVQTEKRINLLFNIGYDIGSFRLSYRHISNAFTSSGFNPGLDMIQLTYLIN